MACGAAGITRTRFPGRVKRTQQFKLGVLWDMIGKKDRHHHLAAGFAVEAGAGDLRRQRRARHPRSHFGYSRTGILDDHYDLNAVGIPTIDLIDFNFPAWHTPGDTLDKIGADSLEIVGQATLYHLCQVGAELR